MVSLEFGASGTYISNATVTGTFVAINALTDCDLILTTNWVNGTVGMTVSVSAGQTIYGVFTSIQTTGKVVAYK